MRFSTEIALYLGNVREYSIDNIDNISIVHSVIAIDQSQVANHSMSIPMAMSYFDRGDTRVIVSGGTL